MTENGDAKTNRDIIGVARRLSTIETLLVQMASPKPVTLTDPSANVKEQLQSEINHLNATISLNREWRDKVESEHAKGTAIADDLRKQLALAEKARLDAQRAEDRALGVAANTKAELTASNLAGIQVELAKTLADTVDKTARALTDRIVAGEARTAALELSRAGLAGGVESVVEGRVISRDSRQQGQWTIGTIIGIIGLVSSLIFGGSLFLSRAFIPATTPPQTIEACQGTLTLISGILTCVAK